MVLHRELMVLCSTVVYQSCRNWVGFRKCQCSPSVYVPCNLAVSLSCCIRAGNPSKEKHHKLPSYPPQYLDFPSPSDCKLEVGRSVEILWNAWGFLESWPQCFSLRLSQQGFSYLEDFPSSPDNGWTIPESNHTLHRYCIAGKDVYLSDLSNCLAQLTVPDKTGTPVSEYASTFAVSLYVGQWECVYVIFPLCF